MSVTDTSALQEFRSLLYNVARPMKISLFGEANSTASGDKVTLPYSILLHYADHYSNGIIEWRKTIIIKH